jgi:hypothetical protein
MKTGLIHRPVNERSSEKQQNRRSQRTITHGEQSRRKHLAKGFIADMSNGDDFEATVSTGCKKHFHAVAPRHCG